MKIFVPVSREIKKGRERDPLDITSSDENLTGNIGKCVKFNCIDNCDSTVCQLCKPCLNKWQLGDVKTSCIIEGSRVTITG